MNPVEVLHQPLVTLEEFVKRDLNNESHSSIIDTTILGILTYKSLSPKTQLHF